MLGSRRPHLRTSGSLWLLVGLVLAVACDPGVPSRKDQSAPPAQRPAPESAGAPIAAQPAESWNPTQIRWEGLDAGLARAHRENKPVMLVVYTDWCPHCKNYSHVFGDPRVVALADKYVMIRVNQDQNDAASARFSPDGSYIPRTLFLTPDGRLRADLTGSNPQFRHFLDERAPESLVQLMKRGVGS